MFNHNASNTTQHAQRHRVADGAICQRARAHARQVSARVRSGNQHATVQQQQSITNQQYDVNSSIFQSIIGYAASIWARSIQAVIRSHKSINNINNQSITHITRSLLIMQSPSRQLCQTHCYISAGITNIIIIRSDAQCAVVIDQQSYTTNRLAMIKSTRTDAYALTMIILRYCYCSLSIISSIAFLFSTSNQ